MNRKQIGSLILMFLAGQSAWAGNAKIKVIGPQGEGAPGEEVVKAEDRVVAAFSYEKTETTQHCGGKLGPTELKVTVYADGSFTGVETMSRLTCPGSGLVRKASYTKHEGFLSTPDLVRLWERLGEITSQTRDLASMLAKKKKKQMAIEMIDEDAEYETHIQRAPDLRGVQSVGVKYLPEVVQTGRAALASVRFMQAFVLEGKITPEEKSN